MLIFHWFYKGKQETVRIPCSLPPRFMGPRGFAWRTIENARDFNDFQGFCSRFRWRPKSTICFSQCLLFPKSLFFQGFSTVSGKPSGTLFFGQAPFAQKAGFIRVLARLVGALFFGKMIERSVRSHAKWHLYVIWYVNPYVFSYATCHAHITWKALGPDKPRAIKTGICFFVARAGKA